MNEIKEYLLQQHCPDGQWHLSQMMKGVLNRQVQRLPRSHVSDQKARYPTIPAGMRTFLDKYFVRHYLQVQDSLLDFITSKEGFNILRRGKLQILDIGYGPAVASLAITDMLCSVFDILFCHSNFLCRDKTNITYILNDPQDICVGTGKQMLAEYISGNQSGSRYIKERILTIAKPFPNNLNQLKRSASNIGEYNIACMSYVIIPMYEEEGIPLITKGINSLIPYCDTANRILIIQDRFRENLIRRIAKALHIRCERSDITQKVYDKENKNRVHTYSYYRCLFQAQETEKDMNRIAG